MTVENCATFFDIDRNPRVLPEISAELKGGVETEE
jgi:hypothetical protein